MHKGYVAYERVRNGEPGQWNWSKRILGIKGVHQTSKLWIDICISCNDSSECGDSIFINNPVVGTPNEYWTMYVALNHKNISSCLWIRG